jgi:hypothetical protein
MNRRHLFLNTTILRGRRLRDENEGAGGTGTPGAGADNAGAGQGNSGGDTGNTGSDSNNTGGDFDPASFWDSPDPDPTATPSGESAGGGNQGSGTGDQSQGGGNFATQLSQQLTTMNFGDPVFTPEVAAEINEGNYAGFEKRLQTQMQTAVRQALAMNVQVLRPFAEQLMQQMRDEFGSTLGERDNVDALVKDFPAAKNPTVAPVIKGIYDQALARTKGNRAEAVKQTKAMLAHMAGATAEDLELDVAPRGAGDSRPAQPAINWLDELTGRG